MKQPGIPPGSAGPHGPGCPARAVRGIIQHLAACAPHGSHVWAVPIPSGACSRFLLGSLERPGRVGAMRRRALRAAPRAVFAVTAIRLQSLTPSRLRRCALRLPPGDRCKAHPRRPHRNGRGAGLRPDLLRQVVQMRAVLNAGSSSPPRHDRRFTDTSLSLAMELPHHASSMPPQDAAGSFALSVGVIGPIRIKGQTGEAVLRSYRVGPVSLRSNRPMRPWLVVNPGGGAAAPWASWPQPSCANNFPCAVTAFSAFLAGQILCASRSSTAFRPQAVRPAHPPPDGSQQGRDGRDLG